MITIEVTPPPEIVIEVAPAGFGVQGVPGPAGAVGPMGPAGPSVPDPVALAANPAFTARYMPVGASVVEDLPHWFDVGAKLRPFFDALATVDTAPVDVLFVGDSITEGTGSTAAAGLPNRYVQHVIDRLRTVAPVATSGRGYVPAYYDDVDHDPYGFVESGSGIAKDTLSGLGRRSIVISAGGTMTISVYGTAADIVHRRAVGAGTFTITVDGGAPLTVSAAAAPYAGGGFTQRVTFARGAHTIVVAYDAGTAPLIEGVMVYDGDETSGVRLWEGAKPGYSAANFNANATWFQSLQAVMPDLIVIALGTNDFRANTTPAAYATLITGIITKIRAQTVPGGAVIAATTPIVLAHLEEPSDGVYTYLWSEYRDQLATIAAANVNCVLVDISARLSKGALIDPADDLHPLDAGHTFIADVLTGDIMRGLMTVYRPASVVEQVTGVRFLTGQYVHVSSGVSTVTTYGNGVGNFQPFDVDTTVTIVQLHCECTVVGSAGSVVRMGIYADDGTRTRPGALAVDAGTVDTTTLGVKASAAISVVLTPGRYWAVAVGQGAPTTSPTMRVANGSPIAVPLPSIGNLAAVFPAAGGLTGALPGIAPALTATPAGSAIRVTLEAA